MLGLSGSEMQKAASMASALVLIFPPAVLILGIQHMLSSISTAVLIFGLQTALLKYHSFSGRYSCTDVPYFLFCAAVLICWSLCSCANFWSVHAQNKHSFISQHSFHLYNNTAVLCFGLCKHSFIGPHSCRQYT